MNGFGQERGRLNSAVHLLTRVFRFPTRSPQQVLRHYANTVLCRSVRRLDAFLRHAQHIEEFTDQEDCVFRISLHPATREIVLNDHTRAGQGELIGEIHLWNEHLVPVPPEGADVAWGILMSRRARYSLILLAQRVATDPRFETVKIFRGKTALGTGKPLRQVLIIARGLGFEVVSTPRRNGFFAWWATWGESIYLWAMAHTFSPGLSKDNHLVRPQWHELWMSRDRLLNRYGTSPPVDNPHPT